MNWLTIGWGSASEKRIVASQREKEHPWVLMTLSWPSSYTYILYILIVIWRLLTMFVCMYLSWKLLFDFHVWTHRRTAFLAFFHSIVLTLHSFMITILVTMYVFGYASFASLCNRHVHVTGVRRRGRHHKVYKILLRITSRVDIALSFCPSVWTPRARTSKFGDNMCFYYMLIKFILDLFHALIRHYKLKNVDYSRNITSTVQYIRYKYHLADVLWKFQEDWTINIDDIKDIVVSCDIVFLSVLFC